MPVKRWSMTGDKAFQGLCTMELAAESANDSKQCLLCVEPVVMPVNPPPPECDGVSTWGVATDPETTEFIWELISSDCTGTGVASPPPDPPASAGLIATVDCCTGEVISIVEETP